MEVLGIMADKQTTVLQMWPLMKEDMQKFLSDRPGWLIDALSKARDKKGNQGWKDVEGVINILQFLKDTSVEYY
jgi:hypothetical protein